MPSSDGHWLPEQVRRMQPALPPEVAGLRVVGHTTVGWDAQVAINETEDSEGTVLPGGANAGANNGEGDASPWTAAMKTRSYDDPGVVALREHLRRNNGIRGLEVCEPHEVDRAARIFHRDGFVVVRDILSPEFLEEVREGSRRELAKVLAHPGTDGRKYHTESGRLPHRYAYGTSSSSRQMLHDPVWAKLTDIPAVHRLINKMYGSEDWAISGAGGDVCLPGAVEYQSLHRDAPIFGDPPNSMTERRVAQANLMGIDTKGRPASELSLHTQRRISENCPATGTINFQLVDCTWENGPIRQIPGTHCNVQAPPLSQEEPDWMRCSTVVGAPAGSAVFRDHRAWHGATPNVSREIRCMPNIEWVAPWAASSRTAKTMPYELWQTLSPAGRHACRFVCAKPGVWPAGAGYMHPLASQRLAAFEAMQTADTDEGLRALTSQEHKKRFRQDLTARQGQSGDTSSLQAKL